ncbi:MAG: hypothetical protein U0M06_11505 [Clostridia bacterium]|nr:hypothetical protein [Clostridia bacterium]
MKKFLTILLCLCMVVCIVACGDTNNDKTNDTNNDAGDNTNAPEVTEAEYKLGMGVVVNMDSSAAGNAQVDATVATVVTDAEGKIVALRLDCAQNKMAVAEGAVDTAATFKTKMELGADYGMGGKPYSPDNNGDGIVLEWDAQAKAFETYAIGKTAAEIGAMETQEVNGHMISTDEDLLTAGCTIQIGDFCAAVVKACEDAQGMTFKTAASFTLGVAAKTTAAESVAATAEENGTVKMYTDFACAVVADGKIIATLNDAIQPNITIDAAGEIVEKSFKATKRELKEDYGMGGKPYSPDNDGDGEVLEWYVQSAAFSNFVVNKTAAEVAAMETKEANGHQISADDALLEAGCTIQITGICAVVAQSANNAR